MPNISHTFCFVVKICVVSDFENIVFVGDSVKTYILLQVILQIAAAVLWFYGCDTFCANQRQSGHPSFLWKTVPPQSYIYDIMTRFHWFYFLKKILKWKYERKPSDHAMPRIMRCYWALLLGCLNACSIKIKNILKVKVWKKCVDSASSKPESHLQ